MRRALSLLNRIRVSSAATTLALFLKRARTPGNLPSSEQFAETTRSQQRARYPVHLKPSSRDSEFISTWTEGTRSTLPTSQDACRRRIETVQCAECKVNQTSHLNPCVRELGPFVVILPADKNIARDSRSRFTPDHRLGLPCGSCFLFLWAGCIETASFGGKI
jgi:hypothetical protein